MVKIEGRYELISNENFMEFLTAIGIPEDSAKKVDSLRPIIEIKVEGDKFTIDSNSGFKNASVAFVLNQEFDDPMPNNAVLKSVATLDGNKLKITSKTSDDRTGDRMYEFSDAGCVVTMTSTVNSNVAKRHYKRL